MDQRAVRLLFYRQAAASDDPEHGLISREHIRCEPGHVLLPPDLDEVLQEAAGNAKTLVVFFHDKGQFGAALSSRCFTNDVTADADDRFFVSAVGGDNQSDLAVEINLRRAKI
jgi:hypothetical protein